MGDRLLFDEFEMTNFTDLVFGTLSGAMYASFRNCTFAPGADLIHVMGDLGLGEFGFEDYNNTVGDNRVVIGTFGLDNNTAVLQKETTKVRVGGGESSIKVTPHTTLDTDWEMSRVLIHIGSIDAVKDVQITLTAYLSSDDDTDWDADPLAGELYMRVYYWGHGTNKHRKMQQSTGVCNNFDADDTVWDIISCTFTPLQAGVVHFEIWYCKAKEATNSNIFYCDGKVTVT